MWTLELLSFEYCFLTHLQLTHLRWLNSVTLHSVNDYVDVFSQFLQSEQLSLFVHFLEFRCFHSLYIEVKHVNCFIEFFLNSHVKDMHFLLFICISLHAFICNWFCLTSHVPTRYTIKFVYSFFAFQLTNYLSPCFLEDMFINYKTIFFFLVQFPSMNLLLDTVKHAG